MTFSLQYLRYWLWALLALALVYNYTAWIRDYPTRVASTTSMQTPATPLGSTAPTLSPSAPTAATTTAAATVSAASPTKALGSAVAAAAVASVHVRTDLLAVDVSLQGGELTRAQLPAYPQSKNTPDKSVELLNPDPASLFVLQGGLEGAAGQSAPTHLAQYTSGAPASLSLPAGQNELTLKLAWSDPQGVRVIKSFTFHRARYDVEVAYHIENGSSAPWSFAPYVQLLRVNQPVARSYFNPSTYAFKGPAIDDGTKFQTFDISKNPMLDTTVRGGYLAALQPDFLVAVIPPATQTYHFQLQVQGVEYLLKGTGETHTAAAGESVDTHDTVFIGPKLHSALVALQPRLPYVADYGRLTIIAEPMFQVLNYVHKLIGNWGFTIIIVTALLKLVFYPLAEASGRSMAKMKALAPRLNQLRETFKDDREKLNRAMMELYQREKINPLAGCLPMVIQIPVFFAFYYVLRDSVELRQAPFIGWLTDLSVRDPYYVLPAIMMGAMFVQYRLNPQVGDATQQKVMMFMPLAMSATFAFFPAGLVLYWVTNTLLSILQQWNINRRLEARAQR